MTNLCLKICALCLPLATLQAQQPTTPPTPQAPKPKQEEPLQFTLPPSPELAEPDADTLPDEHFRQYNPAKKSPVEHGTLGNLGSSARPLFFENPFRPGFDLGFHAFDIYQVHPADLRFYRNAEAFSEVEYTKGTQDDSQFNARFARTFGGDGTTFALDYRNPKNLGEYRYQFARQIALALGLWVPVSQRYEAFLVFADHDAKQQENGGIVDGTAFGGQADAAGIPVNLPDQKALTAYGKSELQFTQHLKILGKTKTDSTGHPLQGAGGSRALRLTHVFTWGSETLKFADAKPAGDKPFFGNFLVDERGIRQFTDVGRVENTFSLTTFKPNGAGKRADFLTASLYHGLFSLNQEPEKTKFSNLFLGGSGGFTPSERFQITANAQFGLLETAGQYLLDGKLTLGLGPAGELRASILSERYTATQLQSRLFVSQQKFWETNFSPSVYNTFSATYALPKLGFEATATTHLLNGYVFFNRSALPEQAGAPVQVLQLFLRENLRFGHWHLDNLVGLQNLNRTDILHLPTWYLHHSLYYSGRLFRGNLLLEAGADFRAHAAFTPDAYQPVSGQFYLQDSVLNAQPYPWLDAFVSGKIGTFRVFARYENLGGIWNAKTPYYLTFPYPAQLPGLRLGIRWRFFDSILPATPNGQGGGTSGPPQGVGRG